MKRCLPMILIISTIFIGLLLLTYWEPPQRDVLDESIWKVVNLNNEPLVKEITLTIRFHDRKVNGSSGCNTFKGRYEVEGEKITINILEATTDNCLNPGIMGQERAFMNYLVEVSTFSVSDQNLILITSEGIEGKFISMLKK